MKIKYVLMIVAIIMSGGFFPSGAQGSEIEGMRGGPYYLFSYFTDNEIPGGGAGLHFAWSTDGLKWGKIDGDRFFFKPKVGRVFRDPNITQGPDGVFHMVWTTDWAANAIGYASSKDLMNWSGDKVFELMKSEPGALNLWAPELFYDSERGVFMIFWSSTIPGRFPKTDKTGDGGYNHRIYYTTTKDFEKFEPTKLLYDPGFNCIDATIIRAGDGYMMFLKNETATPPYKYIVTATADKPEGPYRRASRRISPHWVEGPSVLNAGGKWYVYFDQYMNHKYGAVVSEDLKSWKDAGGELRMPEGVRHGTAFEVTPEIIKGLLGGDLQ